MTVNIKLAKVNGALVPYPTSTPTIVSTAIGTLDQYSNTTAVLEFDAVTYANAVAYIDSKSYVSANQLSGNLANYQTVAGLASNVATLSANSSTFLGTANLQNIQTFITANASSAYTNAVSYVDGKAYVNTSQLSSNLINYQTTAGLAANVATLTSNNATFAYGKNEINLNVNNALTANSSTFLETANLQNIQTFITSNAGAAYSNAVAYVDGKAYVNTVQLSGNLANYQTIAGLPANVASLTANNSTFAYGKTENNLNVNSALIANSSVYLGSVNLQNIQTAITSNSTTAYTNAVSYVDSKAFVNSSVNVTFTGIHVYSSNVTLNAGLIANGSIGTSGQILKSTGANVYWADGGTGSVTQINTANGLSGGPITTSGTIEIIANSGIYVNSSGVFVNTGYIATLTSNNATYAFGKTENNLNVNNALTANSSTYLGSANLQNIQTFITTNASAAYTNATAYVDSKAYVNTSQLSSNLANYQTTAGLSGNVATLTANNATYAYGKTENNLNVNNALTANSSVYLGSANLNNIQTFITTNASAAYTNAVAYVDGKSFVNTSQLSSNLANYQTTAGLASNVATLAANSSTYANASISNVFTIGTSTYYVSNGNVGIGTTTPDAKLAISGTANISGNVAIAGVTTFSANIILGSSGLSANGGFGTSGQVLTSNGTATYWNTVAAGFSNGQSISVNNFVITGSFTANNSNGTSGQVLTSNGTATYWANASGGISTGKAIAMAMIFG